MALELVVFDMAGTTVVDKNFVAKAFKNAFQNNGFDITEDQVIPFMGYHKPEAIQMLLENTGEEFDGELIKEINEEFVNEMLSFYQNSPKVKPAKDAEEVFLLLKEKGIKVALNTGFPRSIAATIVRRFQWIEKNLIDDFIASDEVEKGRPFAYMIETLKQRNNIENGDVMKVGDTVADILEGKNAGCRFIVGVTTGATTYQQLKACNPTHIIAGLSQIPAILSQSFQYHA